MARPPAIKSKNGFSLVELMLTLALLGIVLAGIYTLYFYIQTSFNSTDTRSAINQRINFAYARMTEDIHSASRPNSNTMPVRVVSSGEMHVYTFDRKEEKYIMIAYRFDFEEKSLQRGWVACSTELPSGEENPSYGTIENWETIMEYVIEETTTEDGIIYSGFTDVTASETNERREIKIILIGNDSRNTLNRPIISVKTLTSRSKGFPVSMFFNNQGKERVEIL